MEHLDGCNFHSGWLVINVLQHSVPLGIKLYMLALNKLYKLKQELHEGLPMQGHISTTAHSMNVEGQSHVGNHCICASKLHQYTIIRSRGNMTCAMFYHLDMNHVGCHSHTAEQDDLEHVLRVLSKQYHAHVNQITATIAVNNSIVPASICPDAKI